VAGLFDEPGPRVYAIPPSEPFLDRLAAAALAEAGGDPMRLTEITVLLPTRRAAREFGDRTRAAAGGASLSPMIRTLGDIDSDAPPFEPGGAAARLDPPCPPGLRRFELARLLGAMLAAKGDRADPAAMLAAAGELESVLDELAVAEIEDVSPLIETTLERLPDHLRDAALFLEILQAAWPARLKELGFMDPGRRRAALLAALADQWSADPPRAPVIAAGSTGSIPATARLLAVVAQLPLGCVVLPGLDADLDDAAWSGVDPQHPQSGLKALLETIGVERRDVQAFPGAREAPPARRRRRFVNEALRPAEKTEDWLRRLNDLAALEDAPPADLARRALDGLSLVEAETSEEEAAAIALALRGFLEEDGGGRAMLATPDLALATRVSARLKRWGIDIDSSAGRPLRETAPGAFLVLVLDAALDPDDPAALAAIWKHPLCALGRPRPALRRLAARVERRALRGVRPRDRTQLSERMSRDGAPFAAGEALVAETDAALEPLRSGDLANAADFARTLARSVEAFAHGGETDPWAGRAGEAAAALVRELMTESAALPDMGLEEFARTVSLLSEQRTVREPPPDHPRLQIVGPLEARLQAAEFVVLGGLNEGTWPALKRAEPFFSQAMRRDLGMDPIERRIGLAAHDFAQLLGGPRVLMTRSRRVDGSPAVASRWLWRLQTLARGALGDDWAAAFAPDRPWLDWVRDMDVAPPAAPLTPPDPRPPVETRPRALPVTAVRTWVRDPYAIFAQRILGLWRLDPLDAQPGGMERGSAIHDALEAFVSAHPEALPEDAAERLTALGVAELDRAGLAPAQLAAERPRVAMAARWFIERERERRAAGYRPVLVEATGRIPIPGPAGDFTLSARADRIDDGPGGPAIIDYKTGQMAGVKEAQTGFDPQLALEAAILAEGGFADAPQALRRAPSSLLYVRFRGGRTPGKERELTDSGHDGETLMREARAGLERLIEAFDDPETPYLSQPRAKHQNPYGDYDDLARRSEWANAAEGDSE